LVHLPGAARWEILVLDDDSPDRTWDIASSFASRENLTPIRVIRRRGNRGLSAAVLEGFLSARGRYLGVMDADLSHDPALWPRLVDALEKGAALAVGSRRVPGGGADTWPWYRRFLSDAGTRLCRTLIGVSLRDPMSGFFAVRRELFDHARPFLRPRGYKILLEIAVKSGVSAAKIAEIPFIFKDRRQGYSKLTARVALGYLTQLVDLILFVRGAR
jgi:dolichol-phosphate mannosyltransferase